MPAGRALHVPACPIDGGDDLLRLLGTPAFGGRWFFQGHTGRPPWIRGTPPWSHRGQRAPPPQAAHGDTAPQNRRTRSIGGAGPRCRCERHGPAPTGSWLAYAQAGSSPTEPVPGFSSAITPTSIPPPCCRNGHPLARATAASRSSAVTSE